MARVARRLARAAAPSAALIPALILALTPVAIVASALALAPAGPAMAGAWPRAKGTAFVSTKLTFSRRPEGGRLPAVDSSVYAEFGLGRGWMLGFEGSRPRLTQPMPDPQDQTVVLYIGGRRLVVPISTIPGARPSGAGTGEGEVVLWLGHGRDLGHGLAWGWNVGLGRRFVYAEPDRAFVRPGLSWGKGFGAGVLPWPGWMSADLKVELPVGGGAAIPKLDLAFGVHPGRNWTLLVGLWIDRYPGQGTGLRIAPAVLRRFGKTQLGLQPEIPLRGGDGRKLTLMLWSEF